MSIPYFPRVLTALFSMVPLLLSAQTFQGSGATIPDNGDTLEIPIDASSLPDVLNTATFGLEQVCFSVDHDWIGELQISLQAPDGTVVLLCTEQGGGNLHYTNTCFSADAALPITQAIPPFTGTFRPQGELSQVNNGQDGNGTWYLRVLDLNPDDLTGEVLTCAITFGSNPAAPLLEASNLPIVVINTLGQTIPDEPKIDVLMGVVDNGPGNLNHPSDPFNNYDGAIGIELRGNSSQGMSPKKSYSVELRDSLGEDLDAPLVGLPAESDWVLQANYFDKSLMNNTLTNRLAMAMGHYAPRSRYVELVVNGDYLGVYVLMEKIKRGAARLDIAKLQPDEVSGDDLTGGYILSVDWDEGSGHGFVSNYPPPVDTLGHYIYLAYQYPKPEHIVDAQKTYIQSYIGSFEDALAGPDFADTSLGYRAYADQASFVDFFLINELSRNVDAYRVSSFLYKDKDSNGGRLHAGPVWDFDLAWGNADYCHGWDTAGWAYDFGALCPEHYNQVPFWWSRLLQDSSFTNAVRCRWNELRDNVLSPAFVDAFCDSVATLLDGAEQRNFIRWPILGTYVWPNPQPVPTSYAGEVQELKDFMEGRWAWMDANLPGDPDCALTSGVAQATKPVETPFPNPFAHEVFFRTTGTRPVMVKLVDVLGRTVLTAGPFTGAGALHHIAPPAELARGSYLLVVSGTQGASTAFRLQH
jgi:subtilisin-like proprotein convertase family protein